MYNGVLAVIVGEAWLFGSVSLIKYALLVLVLFHLFVVLYEEPRSRHSSANPTGSTAVLCRAGASRRGHFKGAPGAPPKMPLQPLVTPRLCFSRSNR